MTSDRRASSAHATHRHTMVRGVVARLACGLGALALVLGLARSARASSFTVNPIKVVLSGNERSTLLTVQNQSSEALRFQVSVNGWSQSAGGEMVLSATKDIVVYPSILSLAPGEQRKLRIGTTVGPGPLEKSYRIFVEELPPLQSAQKSASTEVRVLTKMGVPIFVEPVATASKASIANLSLSGGKLAFDVRNEGNVHFVAGKVIMRTLDGAGRVLHTVEAQGWYILAGTVRHFEVALPLAECGKARAVLVEVPLEKATASARLQVGPGNCGP
jgi:fimbrial chaperone protein